MKNKFLCFRPVGIESESESNRVNCFGGDRAFTSTTIASNKDSKISVVKSPVLRSSKRPIHRSSSSSRKSETKRSLSGVVKAVLFEISLSKKARKRKAPRLTLGSGSCESKSPETSTTSSSSSSSHSSPTLKKSDKKFISKTRTSLLKKKNQSTSDHRVSIEVKTENDVINCPSSNTTNSGWFLVLIALSVTILYGRVFAILFTSLCIYFIPRRRIREWQRENMVRSSAGTESSVRDYRKRVIMEGLLERNHQ